MKTNIILATDYYKVSHAKQYPPKTEHVFSYIESRGSEFDKLFVFGVQHVIEKLSESFPTKADVNEADFVLNRQGIVFDRKPWDDLVRLGEWPLKISSIGDGAVVSPNQVILTLVNTLPEFYWVVGYLEPILLRAIWYMTSVSSLSFAAKRIFLDALHTTGSGSYDKDSYTYSRLKYMLHDFGARGVSSEESSALGGMAHLIHFEGSDNLPAISMVCNEYDAFVGSSIPASEHSTITSWGKENEYLAYSNLLELNKDTMVACVIDSYDMFKALDDFWFSKAKKYLIHRTKDNPVVLRPDSGDPLVIIPKILEMFELAFPEEIKYTDKGFKYADKPYRFLWGDGINLSTIKQIMDLLIQLGWAADTFTFGMGGALLQSVTRDTHKFAMKASAVCVDGVWHDVFKAPVTDSGKRSKAGIILPSEFGDQHVPYDSHSMEYLLDVYSATGYDVLWYHWDGSDQPYFKDCNFEELQRKSNKRAL